MHLALGCRDTSKRAAKSKPFRQGAKRGDRLLVLAPARSERLGVASLAKRSPEIGDAIPN
jgi:hypothetical protein